MYPKSLQELIDKIAELPSLGPKSAERIALHLLDKPQKIEQTMKVLKNLEKIGYCEKCNSYTEATLCSICKNPSRNEETICIVEEPHQVDILEKSGIFKGVYYVLHGSISPLEGKGPQDLKLGKLTRRIKEDNVKEIILAVNQDFTLHYMIKLLKKFPVHVSCLARGIPVGSKIEYTDEVTLKEAFKGRKEV